MSRSDHITRRWQQTMGYSWWWRRFADLVDRRQDDGTVRAFDYDAAMQAYMNKRQLEKAGITRKAGLVANWKRAEPVRVAPLNGEKPEVFPRPAGMSRQTHRRLYREACKIAGVPYRTER